MAKVETKKISPGTKKHLEEIVKDVKGVNKFGHRIGKAGAFIDEQLEKGRSVEEVVKAWKEANPDKKPIDSGRVMYQAQHLLQMHSI